MKLELTVDQIWEFLVENYICTDEELQLITCINGYNIKTLNDCLYVRTGYRDIEQYIENQEGFFI